MIFISKRGKQKSNIAKEEKVTKLLKLYNNSIWFSVLSLFVVTNGQVIQNYLNNLTQHLCYVFQKLIQEYSIHVGFRFRRIYIDNNYFT